jgi:quercetin dioxygenase-like cupin family protein
VTARTRRTLTLLATLAIGAAAGAYAAAAVHTTVPPAAVRLPLAAQNNPTGARGRTLGLTKVTIPPGTKLALHYHPGTQVAYIASGRLTYSVKKGHVTVMTGPADTLGKVVSRIGPGQTGAIDAGDWIVEQPTVVHSGANNGRTPVVIYLATLFPIGAAAAIPVK